MDKSFHYLLMANQAMFHKGLLSGLKDTSLTIGQPKVLDYLKDNDGASQKEIAMWCHIEPSSLTVILNKMEEKNIIERRMLNGNRRTLYVFLTDLGRKLLNDVENMFSSMEDDAFMGVSEDDKNKFMEVFFKIYCNLLGER